MSDLPNTKERSLRESGLTMKKTVDDDRILRIEEEDGSAITIYKERGYGHILSIFVAQDERGQGIGSELLSAAEQELFDCGIQWMDAEYANSLDTLSAFFEGNDFTVKPGADILSIPISDFLRSSMIKKFMKVPNPGTEFVPLSGLSFSQWDELIERFKKKHLRIENQDIVRLEQDISGVVYDEKEIPQAVVFCSEVGGNLHVDFLMGFEKNPQKYVMASLQGMLSGLIERYKSRNYENLTAISINKNVPILMQRALDGGQPQKTSETLYARKRISGDIEADEILNEELDKDRKELWRREIRKVPLQANISYKLSWGRMNGSMDTKADEPEKEMGAEVSINYDKDEDAKKGLVMEDTIRITAQNLGRFAPYLPPDIARDIIRPFYRGLAVLKDGESEPSAIMAWVYDELELDQDSESNILFFNASTKEDGKTLLSEYKEEIDKEDVMRSYFWLPTLSDTDIAVLSEMGFDIDKKESVNHYVTLDELEEAPLLKNKTAHSVLSLGAVSDRQFRRGVAKCLYMNNEGKSEDMAYLSKGWFDQEVSSCFILDGGVVGMILTHRLASGDYYIDFVRSMGSDPEIETIYLVRYALMKFLEKCKYSPRIVIRLDNEADKRLAKRLFSKLSGEIVNFGEREEA